jgi:hypothetical protein
MITAYEVQALIDLLKRTPMSPSETLFAGGFVEKLAQLAAPAETPPAESDPAPAEAPDPERAPEPPIEPPAKAPPLRPGPLAGY